MTEEEEEREVEQLWDTGNMILQSIEAEAPGNLRRLLATIHVQIAMCLIANSANSIEEQKALLHDGVEMAHEMYLRKLVEEKGGVH